MLYYRLLLSIRCASPTPPPAFGASLESFLTQMSGDLVAYAQHAGRKTVERADVELLLNRQRLIGGQGRGGATLNTLLHMFLPLEYVEDLIPVARAHNEVVPPPPGAKVRACSELSTCGPL